LREFCQFHLMLNIIFIDDPNDNYDETIFVEPDSNLT